MIDQSDPKFKKVLKKYPKKPTMMGLKAKSGPTQTEDGIRLPIIAVGNRRFYFDEKMSQIRNVSNAYEFYNLDKYEVMAIQNKFFDFEKANKFKIKPDLKKYNLPKMPDYLAAIEKDPSKFLDYWWKKIQEGYQLSIEAGDINADYSIFDWVDDFYYGMDGEGFSLLEMSLNDYLFDEQEKGGLGIDHNKYEDDYRNYFSQYYNHPIEKNEREDGTSVTRLKWPHNDPDTDERYDTLPEIEAEWTTGFAQKLYDEHLPKRLKQLRKPTKPLRSDQVPLKNKGN